MPAMSFQHGWRRMVTGNHDNIRLKTHQDRYGLINFFDNPDLLVKVAVFPGRISSFYMQEKEVIVGIILLQSNKLFFDGGSCFQGLHTD